MQKAWQGRFAGDTDPEMDGFCHSIDVDRVLWPEDLAVNRAWAEALHEAGVLTDDQLSRLRSGLDQVEAELQSGSFQFLATDEDIHMAIERRLTEIAGPDGGAIHTGRSRNDQTVTDLRLYLKRRGGELLGAVRALQQTVLDRARETTDIILPGYTHLQQAQPLRLAHYLLSAFWVMDRDCGRLTDALNRADEMPLGSGALSGTTFAIDREALARRLGFARVSPNSVDAVSQRDFVAEFVNACALAMAHLSRYAEDLIIWSSREFGFVVLSDHYTTGSSMMPQKKNPDALELIRGRCARLLGRQTMIMGLLKGLPLTYNRDLQEDKAALFDALETTQSSVSIFRKVVETAGFDGERCGNAQDQFMLATDVADYLVGRGMPFREAHEVVGRIVRRLLNEGKSWLDLTLPDWQEFSAAFDSGVMDLLEAGQVTELRTTSGGTSRKSLEEQMAQAEEAMAVPHDSAER